MINFKKFKPIYLILLLNLISITAPHLKLQTVHASSSTILINEVLYDPSGSDSGHEWLELINISSTSIDLEDWTIEKGGTSFELAATLPSYQISPNEYLLIGENEVQEADINVSDLSMQNGGSATDGVRILDSTGHVVDTLLYDFPNTNMLPGDVLKTTYAPDVSNGNSLARINTTDTDRSATDFAETSIMSPGDENMFAPEAVITFPEETYVNTEIEVSAQDSSDPDENISSWHWAIIDSEDKVIFNQNSETFTYTFEDTGIYEITLEIRDRSSLEDSVTEEIHIIQDPNNPTLFTINDIKGLEDGTEVAIQGVLTAPLSTIYKKESYVQLQDQGIRVRIDDIPQDLKYNETYRFMGELDTVYGEKRLHVEKILEGLDDYQITAQSVNIDEINADLLGILVKTEAKISKIRDRYVYLTDSQENEYRVYISKYSDIELLNTDDHKGQYLTVTGIISQYGTDSTNNPKIRIMPRFTSDIQLAKSPQLASTGLNSLTVIFAAILISTVLYLLRIVKVEKS
jgi:hypothetical protein